MPREKSVGAVIFHTENRERHYLLLFYFAGGRAKSSYWDFPKGHMEVGENEEETLRREVAEETGIKQLELVKGFRESINYFFRVQGKTVFKTVIFYLAETRQRQVSVSFEHKGYVWLKYPQALLHLKFQNAKTILKKVNRFLSQKI